MSEITKDRLSRMYLEQFMSIRVIATVLNKGPTDIKNLMIKYHIPIRRQGYKFR